MVAVGFLRADGRVGQMAGAAYSGGDVSVFRMDHQAAR